MLVATQLTGSNAPDWPTYVALGVSGLALLVSGISVWRANLSPMRLIVASRSLELRITAYRSHKSRWFVVDAIADCTFTNAGARPGIIQSMRLKVEYPELSIPRAFEYFELNFEVDRRKDEKYWQNRIEWADKTPIGDVTPLILLPKESQSKRLVFWQRWEHPVIQESLVFTLEIYTDSRQKWQAYDTWEHDLMEETWVFLINKSGRMSADSDGIPDVDFEDSLKDLHKYTGPKGKLKGDPALTEPSYLDYPRWKSIRHWLRR